MENEFAQQASEDLDIAFESAKNGVEKLVGQGFLHRSGGKLFLASALDMRSGELQIKPKGFGFVLFNPKAISQAESSVLGNAKSQIRNQFKNQTVDDEDGEDIYIPVEKLNGAIHGDFVLAKYFKRRGRLEGEIVGILERRATNIVGTFMKSKNSCFVIPDDERFGKQINVRDCDINKLFSGEKVVVSISNGNDKSKEQGEAKVIEVLGDAAKVGVDILGIMRTFNLYQEFEDEVNAEAEQVAIPVQQSEIDRRLDLRKKTIITIDPADAKDLDDAVHFERLPDGTMELGVHIADVTHYVVEGGKLDTEAYNRGTSVYFPDRVIPMLPKNLSNNMASLLPNDDRLALSVIMKIDPKGDILKHQIVESVINIKEKLSYDQVQALLDSEEAKRNSNNASGSPKSTISTAHKKLMPMLNDMATLTKILEKKRRARGEVLFDVPEPKIILDPLTGKIKDVIAYPHHLSHRIIETFMVLCNEVVAEKMKQLELPFIYRTHEKPAPEKVNRLIGMLKPFAVQHNISADNATGHAYSKMLSTLSDDVKPIVSSLALRSMQKAKYSPENIGHFGLGATFYSHFTSPIRRYPDLVIHRIIKMMLNKKLSSHKIAQLSEFVADAAEQSSKMEQNATMAEREVDNLKRAEFMQDKIGETFSGTISGIQDFGVFVYLPNTVEGLVKIENMPKDSYHFNEKHMTLVGKKRTFKMGDKIDVLVISVNMPRRQVEFSANVGNA